MFRGASICRIGVFLFKGGIFIKRNALILSALLIIAAVTVVYFQYKNRGHRYIEIHPIVFNNSIAEKDLYGFINRILCSPNGVIYTNTLLNSAKGDLPGGDEIISESVGLIMQYAIEAESNTLFEKYYLYLKEVMKTKNNIIIWKVDENDNRRSDTNALIDDLRISSILIRAYEKWGAEKYLKMALEIASGLKKYNMKNGGLVDFYDDNTKAAGDILTICYIDLEAMKKLSHYDEEWLGIYSTSKEILSEAGYGKDKMFFHKSYNTGSRTYGGYTQGKVNMIEQAITIENAIKGGIVLEDTLEWLKNSFNWYGFIVNEYTVEDGKPASSDESPSVYAIYCRVYRRLGDMETADKLYNRMLSMKVKDDSSLFYGGFANVMSGEAFSFDNLQALITIRYKTDLER